MIPNIVQAGVSFANPNTKHLNLLGFVPQPQPTWSNNSINGISETSGVLNLIVVIQLTWFFCKE